MRDITRAIEQAEHRLALLWSLHAALVEYRSLNGAPPQRHLHIHGQYHAADRRVLDELLLQLDRAALAEAERVDGLLNTPVTELVETRPEQLF